MKMENLSVDKLNVKLLNAGKRLIRLLKSIQLMTNNKNKRKLMRQSQLQKKLNHKKSLNNKSLNNKSLNNKSLNKKKLKLNCKMMKVN